MSFHIPFHKRVSNRQHLGTIYIDEPLAPAKRRFNWWGFNGMCLSFLSLLTLGFLSPLALLLSLIGLRRPGKGMATVGTMVSLAGIALIATIVITTASAHHHRTARIERQKQTRINAVKIQKTQGLLATAYDNLVEYRGQHEGRLPADIEGNMLVVSHVDPWGQALRYEPEAGFALVRSAGPDQEFLTPDDLIKKVSPKVATAAGKPHGFLGLCVAVSL